MISRFFTFCVGVVGNSDSGQTVHPRICWLDESFAFASRTICSIVARSFGSRKTAWTCSVSPGRSRPTTVARTGRCGVASASIRGSAARTFSMSSG